MEVFILYLLLNKNQKIAKFSVDKVFDTITIEEQYIKLPSWYGDLDTFIQNRRAPKHRENIEKLLQQSGCNTLSGFLNISHALSLIDTFWVKYEHSNLDWEAVSLFTHPFNEVIAKTAFEGGLHGQQLSTTSPEYGTDGSFAKCWIRENEIIKMLKRGSSGASNAGLEPYSEFYASQLVSKFTSNFVNYDLRTQDNRLCSVCDIFTSEDYGFIPYAAVDRGNTSVMQVLRNMKDLGFVNEVKTMFVIDALIMNANRHKNNFGFIIDNKTLEIQAMAPLFDHNLALMPYAIDADELTFDSKYYREHGPRIGDEWVKAAAMCLTSKTRKLLIDLHDFKFEKHRKLNLPDWRLESLTVMLHDTIEAILELDRKARGPIHMNI